MPKSFEITIAIDGVTYRAVNVKQVNPPPDRRRLILSLTRDFLRESPDGSGASLMLAREQVLKNVFTEKFPHAEKLSGCITENFSTGQLWKYVLRDAQPEHIEWARNAKECGLIDSYISDYDPED